jgi:hypothetical protein
MAMYSCTASSFDNNPVLFSRWTDKLRARQSSDGKTYTDMRYPELDHTSDALSLKHCDARSRAALWDARALTGQETRLNRERYSSRTRADLTLRER